MYRKIVVIASLLALLPGVLFAETRQFLGTRTGWSRTEEVFLAGRYKGHNLFLVIGAKPTNKALHTISGWRSSTTYFEDVRGGAQFFTGQIRDSVESVPENSGNLGDSTVDLFVDPVKKILDFNIITPAALVFKTAVNLGRIGWHGAMIIAEPAFRIGAGSVALLGAPLVKPAAFLGVSLTYTGTAAYGYGSSTIAGTIFAGATGAAVALDVASAPLVAAYEWQQPETPVEEVAPVVAEEAPAPE